MANDKFENFVVLVHGTFARGAEWTHPGSKIASTITNSLPGNSKIISFEWSGHNSHNARLVGGIELGQQLQNLKDSKENASIYIVSHSHGGNVLAYALRDSNVRGSIDGVVCLGTPFIGVKPRSLKPTLRLLKICASLILILAFLFLFALSLLVATLVFYEPKTSNVISGVIFIIVGGLLSLPVFRLGVFLNNYIKEKVYPRLKDIQGEIITSLKAEFYDVEVLNIQTRHDEAAGYLGFIKWISNIPYRVWSPTFIAWLLVVITVPLIWFYIKLMIQSEDWVKAPLEAFGGFLLFLIAYFVGIIVLLFTLTLVSQVVCIFWAKLSRGHALGFGEEGFLKNWLADIYSSSQPEDAEKIWNENYEVKGRGLHHSQLYEDSSVLQSITNWLVSRTRKSVTIQYNGKHGSESNCL